MDSAIDTQAGAPENTQGQAQADTQDAQGAETQGESVNWEVKAKELENEVAKYKRIAERNAKKATEVKETKESRNDSDGLDYGKKAFLLAQQIQPDEFGFVEEQMEESGIKDIEKLISNSYFQATLKARRDSKAVAQAIPGNTRTAQESAKTKVDYWLQKGEMPPNTPENRELRQQIVNRRMEAEKGNQFSSNPVIFG